jgi:hypothetical protein
MIVQSTIKSNSLPRLQVMKKLADIELGDEEFFKAGFIKIEDDFEGMEFEFALQEQIRFFSRIEGKLETYAFYIRPTNLKTDPYTFVYTKRENSSSNYGSSGKNINIYDNHWRMEHSTNFGQIHLIINIESIQNGRFTAKIDRLN